MRVSISSRKVAFWLFGTILVLNAVFPVSYILERLFDSLSHILFSILPWGSGYHVSRSQS